MFTPTQCGFTCAGGDTYVRLVNEFIKQNPNFMSPESVSAFMEDSVNNYLYSFGSRVNYETKIINPKHVSRFIDKVSSIKSVPFMKNANLYWDSGGYQIANGAFFKEDIPHFIDLYYDTLLKHNNLCDYAFILDVPPGPKTDEIFKDHTEIEDLNRLSYQKCIDIIPPNIRKDKVIYIHHFRTKALYEIWGRLLNEGYAKGYDYFGTGGLVVDLSNDQKVDIILYCVPMCTILKYCIQNNIKKFKFHVLGASNLVDVIYHKLFEYHIKQVHDVEMTITYDSSVVFKAMAIGRYIQHKNDYGFYDKINIKSDALHLTPYGHSKCTEDLYYDIMSELSNKYNFPKLNKHDHPIYKKDGSTLSPCSLVYLMCWVLYVYKKHETDLMQQIPKIYDLYKSNDLDKFQSEFKNLVCSTNRGHFADKTNNKHRLRALQCFKSLDVLKSLNEKYGLSIIDRISEHNLNINPAW